LKEKSLILCVAVKLRFEIDMTRGGEDMALSQSSGTHSVATMFSPKRKFNQIFWKTSKNHKVSVENVQTCRAVTCDINLSSLRNCACCEAGHADWLDLVKENNTMSALFRC